MDIEVIPEFEAENDIDKDQAEVETPTFDYESQRIQTEYGDEDQEFDFQTIENVLQRYNYFAGSLLVSLICIQISLFGSLPLYFSVLPLIVLEAKLSYDSINNFRYEYELITNLMNNEHIRKLVSCIGNIFSYILLVLYMEDALSVITISSIPLLISAITQIFIRNNPANYCVSFSDIVFPN